MKEIVAGSSINKLQKRMATRDMRALSLLLEFALYCAEFVVGRSVVAFHGEGKGKG